MPRTYVAKSVTNINPIHFARTDGSITGLIVHCEVNFGTIGLDHDVDIWDELTPTQQQKAQAVFNFVKAKVEEIMLGGD